MFGSYLNRRREVKYYRLGKDFEVLSGSLESFSTLDTKKIEIKVICQRHKNNHSPKIIKQSVALDELCTCFLTLASNHCYFELVRHGQIRKSHIGIDRQARRGR
jgi:hypothetical protein